ncbi:hypothetical protein N7535_003282 [Penicillium sp. DV-2018c]|nr:hypothetical protein N7535_003282 [Penicillium sp. DV-2018c]
MPQGKRTIDSSARRQVTDPKRPASVFESAAAQNPQKGQSMVKPSNDYRFSLLQRLVQEISADSSFAGVDPETKEAVLRLNDTFCKPTNLPPSNGSSPDDEVPRSHDSNCSSNEPSRPRNSTPPPILDDKLELAVFTHPALGNNNNMTYDRLEILGDAYIELIATKLVWETFPDLPPGRISQIRELLVKNETLSGFAEIFGFDRKVSVPANYNTPSKRWTKTKGDVFEAYVAAVILSDPVCGYEIARHWLTGLWMPLLRNLGHQKAELRCKEALAKKIMGKNVKLEYLEERPSVQQKGGTQTFFVALYLTGWGWVKRYLGSGQGLSKAAAGDEAARVILANTPLLLEIMSAKESWESQNVSVSQL